MGIGAARAEIIKNRHLDIEEAIGFGAGGSMGRFRGEVCTGGAQARNYLDIEETISVGAWNREI